MRKIQVYIIALLLCLLCLSSYATHNRAGEITYRLVSGYTFEVTITTYTYSLSNANRDELSMNWGDNRTEMVPLKTRDTLPDYYLHNTYVARHTFPGLGSYILLVEDPNRNEGIKNIPNSVNTVFAIKSTLIINPFVGTNNTPILTNPPIDKAAVGVVFTHNPGAYDVDGDSISYKLTPCEEEGGNPIVSYALPAASKSVSINERTGEFVWDAPMEEGKYNVAILIEEWREGIKISSIVRDMQIDVVTTDNTPPVNPKLPDLCVIAGDTVQFEFTVIDTNTFKGAFSDLINVTALGAPFDAKVSNPAQFSILSKIKGSTTARFTWITSCGVVRNLPWTVLIKSKDSLMAIPGKETGQSLVDMDEFSIKVTGPSPQLRQAEPLNNTAFLRWNAYPCKNAKGFYIYRRQDQFAFTTDTCKGGLGKESGFVRVGTKGINDTSFLDNNNGIGLFQGAAYCYVVIAYFEDGAESLPSNEICVTLRPGLPAILNVSVTQNDQQGIIYLAWVKPRVDTMPGVNGPYTYKIFRSDFNLYGTARKQIKTIVTSDLNDTTCLDTLNTVVFPYSYSIELYDGANIKIGDRQEIASSFYPSISADNHKLFLTMVKNTPWSNLRYTVERYNENTTTYDSIGYTQTILFVDSGLINGKNYCYRVKSTGTRMVDSITYHTTNYSHINCGTAMDTVPPCQPQVKIIDSCDAFFVTLLWSRTACNSDAVKYNIYYGPNLNSPVTLITTLINPSDTVFIYHPSDLIYLKGCYYVTAVDSSGNESRVVSRACSDQCYEYSLPNWFSPNGDGINDFFTPLYTPLVRSINIKIYNRWGVLVFETADPLINWDGRFQKTGQMSSEGTYYYICTVYEDRLSGENVRNLLGFIQMFTNTNTIDNRPAKE